MVLALAIYWGRWWLGSRCCLDDVFVVDAVAVASAAAVVAVAAVGPTN